MNIKNRIRVIGLAERIKRNQQYSARIGVNVKMIKKMSNTLKAERNMT